MVSQKLALTAIFLLAFEGYSVLAGERASITTAPTSGVASPPCQLVIPAVIKAVVQQEPAHQVATANAGHYAPTLPPIIIEEDDDDNWQNLLYLLMLTKNNKRGGIGHGGNSGGYNGGWNCGGINGGGFDGHSGSYFYPHNGYSTGYDHAYYPDEYAVTSVNSPRDINLIIKTDSGTK